MSQAECPHDVMEKFVTEHGLACEACLVPKDFKNYPDWKKGIETRERKAAQLAKNLGRAAKA